MSDGSTWLKVEEGLGTPAEPMWWHRENDQAVSLDGGRTYYLMNEPVTPSGAPVIYDVNQRPVPPKDYPASLEQAAGYAVGRGSVCWESMSGTGVFQEDEARAAVDDLVSWVNENYTKKEN